MGILFSGFVKKNWISGIGIDIKVWYSDMNVWGYVK